MVNKRGQSVFVAAIVGCAMIIIFVITLPTLLSMIAYGQSFTNNVFAKFLMALTPVFLFMMIIYVIIRIARSE